MTLRWHRLGRRGGIFLDAVLVLVLVILGAYLLGSIGINFGELFHGALRFFGL
jgi:hypothetical protein